MMAGKGRHETPAAQREPLPPLDPPAADAAEGRVTLGEGLCIAEVVELRERLRVALDLGALHLDGGELEQIDAAGVQLLCAAVRDAHRQGRPVTWLGVSPRLRAAAQHLGLQQELGL